MIVFTDKFTYAEAMETFLPWPEELATNSPDIARWHHAGSNLCLDFHGDPLQAGLVVFSDGNHHMALQATTEHFVREFPAVREVFYATTPPHVLLDGLQQGAIRLGNLTLSRMPDVFISPLPIMEKLRINGLVEEIKPFMQSRGNVLLVRKNNPKRISKVADVLRSDVRLFMSNRETEKASFEVYYQSLALLLQEAGAKRKDLDNKLAAGTPQMIYGQAIHHREAPQALYADKADVAMVYYHLALRYTRIFPDYFEFIVPGGDRQNPQPGPANLTTTYHAALVNDGGEWGSRFLSHLRSDAVREIYQSHGLRSA